MCHVNHDMFKLTVSTHNQRFDSDSLNGSFSESRIYQQELLRVVERKKEMGKERKREIKR